MSEVQTGPPAGIGPAAPSKYSEDFFRILKDYQESAKQTSDLVRYIGFGLVGLFFAVANSSSPSIARLAARNEPLLIFAVLAGCLVIAFDYLNLFSRTHAQSHLLHLIHHDDPKLRRSDDGRYLFDPNDPYYRLAWVSFYAKQLLAAFGCVVLIFVFAREFLAAP